jgi:uncharacterized protein YbaR (Trm112 family)
VRRLHFETLRPICPHCRFERNLEHPLQLTSVFREVDDIIVEGVLNCSDPACQLEYPIIDGIPPRRTVGCPVIIANGMGGWGTGTGGGCIGAWQCGAICNTMSPILAAGNPIVSISSV